MEVKALSLVPSVLLLHHNSNNNQVGEVTKVEGGLRLNSRVEEDTNNHKVEGDLLHRERVEDMVVAVGAMECHNSSMAGLLNIKAGAGEGLLSKEAEEGMVVVVEDLLLVAHPDHKFPSCTKQPQFLTKLESPLSLHIKQVHHLSHLSLQKWQSSFSRFPSGKRKLLVRPFNPCQSLASL